MNNTTHPRRILSKAIADAVAASPGVPGGLEIHTTDDWTELHRPALVVAVLSSTSPHPRSDVYQWEVGLFTQADDAEATDAARGRIDRIESAVEEALRYPALIRTLLADAGLDTGEWALETRQWSQDQDGGRSLLATGRVRVNRAHPDGSL